MASQSTVLTPFAEYRQGGYDVRNWTYSGHTLLVPRLVVARRRVSSGVLVVSDTTVGVVAGCRNSNDDVLPQKVSFEVRVRYPIQAYPNSYVTDPLAILRDIVAGDEFGNSVLGGNYSA